MMILNNGKYLLSREPIGQGYTSKVFHAIDKETNTKVIIKQMRNLKDAREESQCLAKLPDHLNIVKQLDFFIFDSKAYIVMAFSNGTRLGYYKYGEKRSIKETIPILISILKGLEVIHETGILHCDLSPHNVLFDNQNYGSVKIIDFGCAVSKDENGEYKGKHKGGTRGYSPLELQRNSSHLNNSSDIYSVGCIGLYLLNGERPLNPQESCEKITDLELRNILGKATSISRSERYQTATEMLKPLQSLLNNRLE